MKIVAGNSNRPLADAISAYLKLPMTKGQVRSRLANLAKAPADRYPDLLAVRHALEQAIS